MVVICQLAWAQEVIHSSTQNELRESFSPKKNFQNEKNPVKPILHIQHWQTKQALPVYFVQARQIPMVIINVIFTAGSGYDQNKWGLAQLTANLLDQGTTHRDVDQIANDFADSGADFNVAVNKDMAVISLVSISQAKYLQPALDVFTDVLSHPTFPKDGFSRKQALALAAIKQSEQDPAAVAIKQFYQSLYQNHPYAHPVNGTLKTINQLTVNDAKQFYQQFYGVKNAKIVMVGDLSRQQAETIANDLANNLQLGQAVPTLPETPDVIQKISKQITFPANQTTIILGQLGINHQEPDFFPLFVGNFILGDLPLDSLLFQKVRREQGLAYNTSSDFLLHLNKGPFVIQLQTRAEKASEALAITQKTLRDFIQQGPSEAQLALAKNLIINSFPISLATNNDISQVVTNMVFYHRPLDYLDTYRSKVQAVTTAEIKQAFLRHVRPNDMITITVGPNGTDHDTQKK